MIFAELKSLKPAIQSVIKLCSVRQPAGPVEVQLLLNNLSTIALYIESTDTAAYFDENEEDSARPNSDYALIEEQCQRRFPEWGFYNQCAEITSNVATTNVLVGDAIDDISDIVLE